MRGTTQTGTRNAGENAKESPGQDIIPTGPLRSGAIVSYNYSCRFRLTPRRAGLIRHREGFHDGMFAYPKLRTGVPSRQYRSVRSLRTVAFEPAVTVIRRTVAVLTFCCALGWTLGFDLARPAAATELGSVVYFAGPAGAELFIEGESVGTFPFATALTLAPGLYRVEAKLAGYRPYKMQLTIDDTDGSARHIRVRLDHYRRKHAWTSNLLFAGLGQHYLNKPVKGYFFNLVEATGLLAALAGQLRYSNFNEDYLLLKDQYDTAINVDDIAEYQEAADEAYRQMEEAIELRDTGLLVAAGAIVVSIIDALIFFPSVDAGPGPVPPVVGIATPAVPWPAESPWHSVHAGLVLNF